MFSAEAVAQARRRYEGLQELWAACASDAGGIAEFEQRVRELATACEGLGEPALTALTAQLAESAKSLAQSGTKLHDVAALKARRAVADRKLLAPGTARCEFAGRARNMAARLKVMWMLRGAARLPPPQLLDDKRDGGYCLNTRTGVGNLPRAAGYDLPDVWFRTVALPRHRGSTSLSACGRGAAFWACYSRFWRARPC